MKNKEGNSLPVATTLSFPSWKDLVDFLGGLAPLQERASITISKDAHKSWTIATEEKLPEDDKTSKNSFKRGAVGLHDLAW